MCLYIHLIILRQARAELEKFAAEREVMREKKQSNNRKEEQVCYLTYLCVYVHPLDAMAGSPSPLIRP